MVNEDPGQRCLMMVLQNTDDAHPVIQALMTTYPAYLSYHFGILAFVSKALPQRNNIKEFDGLVRLFHLPLYHFKNNLTPSLTTSTSTYTS